MKLKKPMFEHHSKFKDKDLYRKYKFIQTQFYLMHVRDLLYSTQRGYDDPCFHYQIEMWWDSARQHEDCIEWDESDVKKDLQNMLDELLKEKD